MTEQAEAQKLKNEILAYLRNRATYYKTCSKTFGAEHDLYISAGYSIAANDIESGAHKRLIELPKQEAA